MIDPFIRAVIQFPMLNKLAASLPSFVPKFMKSIYRQDLVAFLLFKLSYKRVLKFLHNLQILFYKIMGIGVPLEWSKSMLGFAEERGELFSKLLAGNYIVGVVASFLLKLGITIRADFPGLFSRITYFLYLANTIDLFQSQFLTILIPSISKSRRQTYVMNRSSSVVIWLITILVICEMVSTFLNIPLSSILAFGGVGGLAVGLSARDIAANLLGGMMLLLNEPFTPGDMVTFKTGSSPELIGRVERVGWGQTRIRGRDTRPTYVPNSHFVQTAVTNMERITHRKFETIVPIRFEDHHVILQVISKIKDKLKSIPKLDNTMPFRVNFIGFGEYSLQIEIFCYFSTKSIDEFLTLQQAANIEIISAITESEAALALPTTLLQELRIIPPEENLKVVNAEIALLSSVPLSTIAPIKPIILSDSSITPAVEIINLNEQQETIIITTEVDKKSQNYSELVNENIKDDNIRSEIPVGEQAFLTMHYNNINYDNIINNVVTELSINQPSSLELKQKFEYNAGNNSTAATNSNNSITFKNNINEDTIIISIKNNNNNNNDNNMIKLNENPAVEIDPAVNQNKSIDLIEIPVIQNQTQIITNNVEIMDGLLINNTTQKYNNNNNNDNNNNSNNNLWLDSVINAGIVMDAKKHLDGINVTLYDNNINNNSSFSQISFDGNVLFGDFLLPDYYDKQNNQTISAFWDDVSSHNNDKNDDKNNKNIQNNDNNIINNNNIQYNDNNNKYVQNNDNIIINNNSSSNSIVEDSLQHQ
eukprot:gene4384-6200_t